MALEPKAQKLVTVRQVKQGALLQAGEVWKEEGSERLGVGGSGVSPRPPTHSGHVPLYPTGDKKKKKKDTVDTVAINIYVGSEYPVCGTMPSEKSGKSTEV